MLFMKHVLPRLSSPVNPGVTTTAADSNDPEPELLMGDGDTLHVGFVREEDEALVEGEAVAEAEMSLLLSFPIRLRSSANSSKATVVEFFLLL
jgi:hypothetical protein